LAIDDAVEERQLASLRQVRKTRSATDVERSLDNLRRVAESGVNVFPALLDATDARASVGEIMNALADVFGRYTPRDA
jgi:methylmalonyl-CoA mutase N-terminal domain/subunit